MRSLILYIIVGLLSFQVNAQDPIFTQYSLVPETINPAFTGFQYNWRAGILHRRQWPDGNRVIDTDYGFLNKMVGEHAALGMTIMNDREAFTNYNFLLVNAVYSYKVEINYEWSFRPGLEVGYGTKSFNFKNLLLEDQINPIDGSIAGNSVDPVLFNNNEKINFMDISTGFIFDNETCWFGASVKHLNRPNISFLAGQNVPLDLFLSIHGGYAFDIEGSPAMVLPDNSKFLLTANYMRQSQFNRVDLGGALKFDQIIFGATATINPERKSNYSHFLTSINPYLSVHFDAFTFGYSYDLSTSKLGHTQGIHELSLTWQLRFCDNCKATENKYWKYSN